MNTVIAKTLEQSDEIGSPCFVTVQISERAGRNVETWRESLEDDGIIMSFSAALEDMIFYATDAYLAEEVEEEVGL